MSEHDPETEVAELVGGPADGGVFTIPSNAEVLGKYFVYDVDGEKIYLSELYQWRRTDERNSEGYVIFRLIQAAGS